MAESIIHNHFKNHLFCKNMCINTSSGIYEIIDIYTEVDLSTYFDNNLQKKVVDILLKVVSENDNEEYFFVVEVNYTNRKNFESLKEYYKNIEKIIDVLEIDVSDCINIHDDRMNFTFRSLFHSCRNKDNIADILNNECKNEIMLLEKREEYFFVGINSIPQKSKDGNYQIEAFYVLKGKIQQIKLEFDMNSKYITLKRLLRNFGHYGVFSFQAEFYRANKEDDCFFVTDFREVKKWQHFFAPGISYKSFEMKTNDETLIRQPSFCRSRYIIEHNKDVEKNLKEKEEKRNRAKKAAETRRNNIKNKNEEEKRITEKQNILEHQLRLLARISDIDTLESEIYKVTKNYVEYNKIIKFLSETGSYKSHYLKMIYLCYILREIYDLSNLNIFQAIGEMNNLCFINQNPIRAMVIKVFNEFDFDYEDYCYIIRLFRLKCEY